MVLRAAALLAIATLSACTTSTAPGATPSPSRSASPQPTPQLTTYTAADTATALAWAPDKRLFYAERSGTIRTFDGTTRRTFATVSTSTDGERGLLGLALSPTFDKDHFVYAFYSRADDLTRQRVVRWLDRGGTGANVTTIVENLPAGPDCCHKGGRIAFGPDGKLYVTLGENHMAAEAQNTSSVRGKILRYNADGTVPGDNPFGSGNPVWAIGLRNPFGLAFSSDGTLMVTDNGPSGDAGTPGSGWDEVDRVVRGGNYQWPTCFGDGRHLQGLSCRHAARLAERLRRRRPNRRDVREPERPDRLPEHLRLLQLQRGAPQGHVIRRDPSALRRAAVPARCQGRARPRALSR